MKSPASWAPAERLARFEREAKTLASLNHPHIAQIYGFEAAAGAGAAEATPSVLIMELVDGEDLAQRLEAAHEQGIVHRDLKPANIKVRPDGTVKVPSTQKPL